MVNEQGSTTLSEGVGIREYLRAILEAWRISHAMMHCPRFDDRIQGTALRYPLHPVIPSWASRIRFHEYRSGSLLYPKLSVSHMIKITFQFSTDDGTRIARRASAYHAIRGHKSYLKIKSKGMAGHIDLLTASPISVILFCSAISFRGISRAVCVVH
jgi:hypothetical protein